MEILNALETKPDESSKKALLAFLVNYRRISKPNTTEYDELNISSTHTPIIMQLSQFRLPYIRTLLSSNVLNFIRKEINLTTYKLWFEILPVLQEYISKDDLCIAALKAIVSILCNAQVYVFIIFNLISEYSSNNRKQYFMEFIS